MIKKLLITAALIIGGIAIFPSQDANAQFVSTAHPVYGCNLGPRKSADLVTITFRNINVTAGPGIAGGFLQLPDNVAITPGSNFIAAGKTLIITDVRVKDHTGNNIPFELREQSQSLAINNLLLTEMSMLNGWQSGTGIRFTGSDTELVGVAIAKQNALDPNFLVDIELIGYVTTR